MSLDIYSILQSSGITDASKIRQAVNNASDEELSSVAQQFSKLLADETSKLSETKATANEDSELEALIGALDKSILGNTLASLDSKDLVREITHDSKGKDVIEQLTSGHLMGVVLSDPNTDNSSSTPLNSISPNQDKTTESLADSLETILASIGQITTDV